MQAKIAIFALVALVALRGVVAKPKPKQAAPAENSRINEIIVEAQQVVQNVTQTLGIKDIPDSKQIVADIQDNAQKLADRVDEYVAKIKTEVKSHEGEIDSVIKQVEAKLSETAASLKQAAGPEASAKAKEIKDKFDQGIKDAVAQVDKLVKAVEPDATKAKADIESAAKTLLDQIVEIGQNVQNQVKSSIAEHEKTHKN